MGYIGLFLHGNPPSHYYVAILPIPILLLSVLIERTIEKRYGIKVVSLVLLLIFILNAKWLFSDSWFFANQQEISDSGRVPYRLQLKAANTIIEDSQGEKITLLRVGYDDHFEGQYAQNYHYLLWWLGNEPVENGDLIYTIYEDQEKLPSFFPRAKVFRLSNLVIMKELRPIRL